MRGESCDEVGEFRLREAIEEEVRDYEVVGAGWDEGECVEVMGTEAGCGGGVREVDTLSEEMKHGKADVDCVGAEVGIGCEQTSEETTVAVAEDEGGVAIGERGEEVIAAAGERGAEGEVFEPAVGAGDGVKVWGGFLRCHRRKGNRRMGVSRARSAAARRWVRQRRRRLRLRRRSKPAARVQAAGMGFGWVRLRRLRMAPMTAAATASAGRWARARRVVVWGKRADTRCSQA